MCTQRRSKALGTMDTNIMEIKADEQFMKNYQAVYYAMNAKPDSKSKLFPKDVVVTLQDIENLNERITDKFKSHYDDAGFRINVSVCYKKGETLEFDSWATFQSHTWNTEKVIDSILIVWEYNAKLPKYPLPQKHTLTVRIADEIRPEEVLNLVISGKLEEVDKIQQEICPIVARVDFINSTLGDELLAIVANWQKGLLSPNVDEQSWYKLLQKYSRVVAYAIHYISVIMAVYCSVKYFGVQIGELGVTTIGDIEIQAMINLIYLLAFCAGFCVIVYKVSHIVANFVFSVLREDRDIHTFKITNGDYVECQQVEQKANNRKRKVIINLIGAIMFNVLCNIIANFLS